MTDTLYISNAIFKHFITNVNGGVVCINREVFVSVLFSSFTLCNVGNQNGACFYFASSKTMSSSNNCISSCIACNGQFIFSASPSSYSNLELNRTTTSDCSGAERGVVYIRKANILSRAYNSSNCITNIHCNVCIVDCERSDSSFYIFFDNPNDILYGISSGGSNHLLSNVCLINNTYNHGQNGYIHNNSPTDESITVDNISAFGNAHTLIDAYKGTITVKHFTGDRFTRTGGGSIVKGDIKEREDYVLATSFAMKLICERNERLVSIKRIRIFPSFAQVLILVIA